MLLESKITVVRIVFILLTYIRYIPISLAVVPEWQVPVYMRKLDL